MHGVFASHYINSVFARKLQIRYSHPRDSGEIVKPFSQVDNKSTMDFATLGPSGYSRRLLELIDLPFYRLVISLYSTGQASEAIQVLYELAASCVFNKQSFPLIV